MTLYKKVNRYRRTSRTDALDPAEVVKHTVPEVHEILEAHPDLLPDVQHLEEQGQGRKGILTLTEEDLA